MVCIYANTPLVTFIPIYIQAPSGILSMSFFALSLLFGQTDCLYNKKEIPGGLKAS